MANSIEHDGLPAIMPHSGRMLLLGRVADFDAEAWRVRTETVVDEGNVFFEPSLGGIPAYVALEIVAQSVAALLGASSRGSARPRKGFVLSVTGLELSVAAARLGQTVGVLAERTEAVGGAHSFRAEITLDGVPVGGGSFTLMIPED